MTYERVNEWRRDESTHLQRKWNPFIDQNFLQSSAKSPPIPICDLAIYATTYSGQYLPQSYQLYRRTMRQNARKMEPCMTDPDFPENDSSLYYSEKPYRFLTNLQWMRPSEISPNAKVRVDGATTQDIIQGELGDCWFLASLAALAKRQSFLNHVLPLGQDANSPAAAMGYYYVRFWTFGEWTAVNINDMLPTRNGRLVFGQCLDRNEFWVALIEKAFARLYGSYEAIDGGFTLESMEDLTGGLSVQYDLGDDAHPDLFSRMTKAYKNNTLMTCTYRGTKDKRGLISLHAYSVTGAFRIHFRGSIIRLVKIRNPYGDEEWTGDWSDSSELWAEVSLAEKRKIGYRKKNEGVFWMSFEDFKSYFGSIKFCTVGSVSAPGRTWKDRWRVTQTKGFWQRNAGSHRREARDFALNPQYLLTLLQPDDFNRERDDRSQEGKCDLTFGLMQEDKRHFRSEGRENLYMAIDVYQIDGKPQSKLGPEFFRDRSALVFSSGKYINRREVTLTASLSPGNFVIVPSRFYNNNGGKFLIRIFSEKLIEFSQL